MIYRYLNKFICIFVIVFVFSLASIFTGVSDASAQVRIMPIGDSITDLDGSYRCYLYDKLRANGFQVKSVGSEVDPFPRPGCSNGGNITHFGFSGRTIQGVRDDVSARINNVESADYALIHLGTNNYWDNIRPDSEHQGNLDGLKSLINILKVKNPNMKILVAQIIPTNTVGWPAGVPCQKDAAIPQRANMNSNITRFNTVFVSQLATISNVYVVNQNAGFDSNTPCTDTYDGVHSYESPDGTGSNKMADRWLAAMLPLLRNQPIPTTVATSTPTPTRVPTPTTVTSTITSAPVPTSPPSTGSMSGLRVQGNRIVNSSGQSVRLVGVNHSGGEYSCVGGDNMSVNPWGFFETSQTPSQLAAGFKAWGINTVRIPLNETCWLGYEPDTRTNISSSTYLTEYRKYSGEAYKTAVQNLVNTLTSQNIAVVLEIHWSAPGRFVARNQSPMLNRQNSIPAWRDIATRFRGNSSVIFDPLNEPFHRFGDDASNSSIAAWECWKLGSIPGDSTNTSRCVGMGEWYDLTGNTFQGGSAYKYEVAGMDEIVQTIRSTGSTNIIMLGGMAYSNNLTRWLAYKPNDANLAASWHVYNFNICNNSTCWNNVVLPVNRSVPVVVGEIGQSGGGRDFVDAITPWFDQNGISYLAWTWNQWGCSGMQLIRDYTGSVNTGCAYAEGQYAAIRRSLASSPLPTSPPVINTGTPTPVSSIAPTSTATPTVVQATCTLKSRGDANCDGKISLADFEIVRQELNGISSNKTADFNSSGVVDTTDYTIWLNNY